MSNWCAVWLPQGHHQPAANLFYGTGIPACILVLDKENASARKGIFMIDAAKGFIKDGPKNRLRDQDVHKIVDTFTRMADVPRYARMVSSTKSATRRTTSTLACRAISTVPSLRTFRISTAICAEAFPSVISVLSIATGRLCPPYARLYSIRPPTLVTLSWSAAR